MNSSSTGMVAISSKRGNLNTREIIVKMSKNFINILKTFIIFKN